MARKRPCRICGTWFRPHPRAGDRQRVCSAEACQRERHRRACEAWRSRNPDEEREGRLRQRVRRRLPEGLPRESAAALLRQIDWEAVRDAVGLEAGVVIEEVVEVVARGVKDAVSSEARGKQGESRQVVERAVRDAFDSGEQEPVASSRAPTRRG